MNVIIEYMQTNSWLSRKKLTFCEKGIKERITPKDIHRKLRARGPSPKRSENAPFNII